MAYFTSVEEFEEATSLDFDEIIITDTDAGKHDCTDYNGFILDPLTGFYRSVWYSCSYNNGVEQIEIDLTRQYLQEEKVVTTLVYKPV